MLERLLVYINTESIPWLIVVLKRSKAQWTSCGGCPCHHITQEANREGFEVQGQGGLHSSNTTNCATSWEPVK